MRVNILLASLIVCLPGISRAELFDRGGGMIYDDVLNITWLEDANMGGSMNWDDSVAWAGGLSFGGFDDWRLASMNVAMDDAIPVDCRTVSELACRDNELGYMYYHNLGGISGDNLSGNQTPFTNIQLDHWAGAESPFHPDDAWGFDFGDGLRDLDFKGNDRGMWAVRDGDIVATDVDSDGVADTSDNCTLIANSDQRDTNGDGYGNACDPDLDNNGVVNFGDVGLWAPFFNTATTGDTDFNGDGLANFGDFAIFPGFFLQPPGPSGVVMNQLGLNLSRLHQNIVW